MRVSIAICLASLASLVSAAPIVRVVHVNKWSSKQINAGATFTLTPIPQDDIQVKPITDEEASALRDVIKDELTKHAPAITDVSQHTRHPHHRHPRHGLMEYLMSLFSTSRPAHRLHQHPHDGSSTVREETGVASRRRKHHRPTIVELETEGAKPSYYLVRCHGRGGRARFYRVRKYADMVIVSIVFTFIGVIALIELWGPMGRRVNAMTNPEGRIRLDDEERATDLADEKSVLQQSEKVSMSGTTVSESAASV